MLQMAIDVLIDGENKQEYLRNIMNPTNPERNKHAKYSEDDFKHFLEILVKTVEKNDPKYEDVRQAWLNMCEKTLILIQNIRKTTV